VYTGADLLLQKPIGEGPAAIKRLICLFGEKWHNDGLPAFDASSRTSCPSALSFGNHGNSLAVDTCLHSSVYAPLALASIVEANDWLLCATTSGSLEGMSSGAV